MIIARTPVRVSLLGGGTDYPDFFRKYGGQTLGLTINKYSYVTVSRLERFFDYNIRVSYSITELVKTVDEIKHPSVRECLKFLNIEDGIEINYVGDLPSRTGLGSSSSFTVTLLHALHAFKGEFVTREQLAEEAVYVEQELIRERVGVQDQYTCAIGGLLHLLIERSGRVTPEPVPLRKERLREFRNHLMLFYTGLQRYANKVLEEQISNIRENKINDKLQILYDLVDQGVSVLTGSGSLLEFGDLLNTAWEIKRTLSSKVTNPRIDEWYEKARRAGAIGGKLLGAGGGGFLLFFVPPNKKARVRSVLSSLKEVEFDLERDGSRLIFYNPN